VLQANPTNPQLDYQRIAEAGAEVDKRASRLKSNLFPKESKDVARQDGSKYRGPQELRSLLKALDNAIVGFVHSPMFENLRVVNSQDSDKAQQDLESIIKLSKEVNKRAKARDQ
jgi:hypothetical protein